MRLDDALQAAEVVDLGLDTAPIIYLIEANPRYDALVTEIFSQIAAGLLKGITSTITLTEVLAQPLQHGNVALQQEYRDLLLQSEHLHLIAIDAPIAELAADLRARYRLRTPDALQIAAAINQGCEAFLTNDTGLRRVTELPILVLDDLELGRDETDR